MRILVGCSRPPDAGGATPYNTRLPLLVGLLEVPDSVLWRFLAGEREFVDSLLETSEGLRGMGGRANARLMKAIAIFRMFSIGPYTRWYYRNNSLRGRQYYLPHLLKHLGKPMGYDCDEVSQVLLRAFRDNGYRAFLYVPFAAHMTVAVKIDGVWVEFDGTYINYPSVRPVLKPIYFVVLGDSVGYYDRETFKGQRRVDPRYVSEVIPLLYRRATAPLRGFREYVEDYFRMLR